jgi:hypothetical protein
MPKTEKCGPRLKLDLFDKASLPASVVGMYIYSVGSNFDN